MAKRRELRVYAREWRDKLGWTLEKAAGLAHMSVSYLSDLEKGSGNKRWNIDHIAALAAAYGRDDPRDLFQHPDRLDPILGLVKGLSGDERETAERILTALHRNKGT